MTVQKRRPQGWDVAVVIVSPSDMRPIRYNGRVWVRVGPRRAQATAEEERRLLERRRWGNVPFDQQPASGAAIDDLVLLLFEQEYLSSAIPADILLENDRSLIHQLQALRFLTHDGTPNNSAVLLFGRDPRRFLPGAYIQFARFDGTSVTDPVRSQHEISGPLSTQLRQLDELLAINVMVSLDLRSGPTAQGIQDYPLLALQQIARNAVMHRTYDLSNAPVRLYWFADRVQILSPGGLFGYVNPDNFGQPHITDYRNPLIAKAMKILGFVQRFGMGIQVARRELAKNGNPDPEFSFEPNFVSATIRKKP